MPFKITIDEITEVAVNNASNIQLSEKEIFSQVVPSLDLTKLILAINAKPRKPRTTKTTKA